jgi:two-component system sensor histidine kinase HydH
MADVFRRLVRESSLLAPDVCSFRRQETGFLIGNLFVLAALLLSHALFSSYLGVPPPILVAVLTAGFLANVIELIWLQGAEKISPGGMVVLTGMSIGLSMALAFGLATLSYRQDIQYFALLAVPIVQSAFRFSLRAAIFVAGLSDVLILFWAWNYFRLHPPADVAEYIEAATIAGIYSMMGILVWILVNHLRDRHGELQASLMELDQAKEKLLVEEKLAAMGRLSSAIAHEIRNPVTMVSCALATATREGLSEPERREMFDIAAREALRLEKLTTDFLRYARPKPPAKEPGDLADSIAYVADICRPRAAGRSIEIRVETPGRLPAEMDSGQVHQALLNLVMNAIDGSREGGTVTLRGSAQDGEVRVEIENPNGPIPENAVHEIFEPFFTTKPSGTGLGLAIARSIARSHGGDVVLVRNEAEAITFRMTLPAAAEAKEDRG